MLPHFLMTSIFITQSGSLIKGFLNYKCKIDGQINKKKKLLSNYIML